MFAAAGEEAVTVTRIEEDLYKAFEPPTHIGIGDGTRVLAAQPVQVSPSLGCRVIPCRSVPP